jgi:hypothetical protein
MMKFSINASQRNKFCSKLLKVKDHEISRLLVLTCDLRDPQEINVKVIEMLSSTVMQSEDELRKLKPKILYQYRFKEKTQNKFGTSPRSDCRSSYKWNRWLYVSSSGRACWDYISVYHQVKPEEK